MIKFLVVIFLITSCSHHSRNIDADWKETQKEDFAYSDMSGQFNVLREMKNTKGMLASRQVLYTPLQSDLPLEKTVAVSKMGTIKTRGQRVPSLRPEAAQHTIWFEKQKFFSQMKIDPKNKKLVVLMDSPEEKWKGTKSYDFPRGNIFCFFTQLSTCLKFHGYLKKNKKKQPVVLIWDSFPYQGEQYRDVAEEPFQVAEVIYAEFSNGEKKLDVNLGNQVINYHYNKDNKFVKMFWVAQGISMKSMKAETENEVGK